jgi:amino acid adenylation domain-containing protein
MIDTDISDREYWRRVLDFGGFTAIPRWTRNPSAGVAEHEAAVPAELASALRSFASENAVAVRTAFLAAHAKVLAILSGESEVATGYAVNDSGRALPCRLAVDPGSWRSLLLETARREAELLSHSGFAVEDLKRNMGRSEPAFETVFGPAGAACRLDPDSVLSLTVVNQGDGFALRVQYRTEALDAESAERFAGYHLTALARMVADADADHGQQSLLSAEELHFQIEGLAGPRRELPNLRFHELFQQRVAVHPDAVAGVCGDLSWTYGELNSRANRIGRALLERGLQPEGIVAVVMERNLDWMASVLAVFKAGGVYLPIEPHFPADRIANMLSRAGCRLALTEPGSDAALDEALKRFPQAQKLFVGAAYEESRSDENLGVQVTAQQAAYIYFTSGSTGEPKGAMCEHAGFLNHLFAKVEDLGITEGQAVAQIAPQCFDISLWQLAAALLVGGRTLIIEQTVILDVQKFIAKIVEGKVSVMQVVPSYLEALLTYLEQNDTPLPDLHCVSVTGEAISKELVQRWFAAKPGIKLVNAYGLTETSDDTNHEVMDRPPDGSQVPLGRCINNAHVYIVDEQFSPVPLGAPGEIVFSGVCVGRGYVNDPERTAKAFMADPLRPGERLYRSGDFGRWRPDGKLEFLGRQDAQVKIRGFRIEIGDIESALLRAAGVRMGAVVVAGRPDGGKQLAAFYSGEKRADVASVRDFLARSLPEYMVPSVFHRQDSLPLTGNGKIDKKLLKKRAAELGDETSSFEPPQTPTEQVLAAAWAKALGVAPETVGRHDNFFDRGGTSLTAVKLVIALKNKVSLKDIARHRVLAELAEALDGKGARPSGLLQKLSEGESSGPVGLVCFPYAGGNAVNFQPMAKALRKSGMPVYAVEYPGHDLAAGSRSFASIAEIADKVVGEIAALGLRSVILWGHSSGVAFAVEAARRLLAKGVDVRRVFLGAQLIGDATTRRAAIETLKRQSNAEIAARLNAEIGLNALHDVTPSLHDHAGAAYRHDFNAANEYLAGILESPPEAKLSAPLTVAGAADDPAHADLALRYRDWQIVAGQVDLHIFDHGGHYFLRTRPQEAADIILRAAA